jgi:hypothetical protein
MSNAVVSLDLARVVDQLGAVKAQIADLQKIEKELKAELAGTGFSFVDGAQYRASIHWQSHTSIDWRAIAEHFNPSRQLVTAHSSHGDLSPVVRVSARKTS